MVITSEQRISRDYVEYFVLKEDASFNEDIACDVITKLRSWEISISVLGKMQVLVLF